MITKMFSFIKLARLALLEISPWRSEFIDFSQLCFMHYTSAYSYYQGIHFMPLKAEGGIEPSLKDLQSLTLPLCYPA